MEELPPGEYVMLDTRDMGKGMEKEILARIFEPLFTTKPKGKGTGLGLSTVFGIVKQNNGYIFAESVLGEGTRMKILFPRFAGDADSPAGKTTEVPLSGTETIMVVEDEEALLDLATTSLKIHGYKVIAARSPEKAILIYRMLGKPIDLLVTDVIMLGMNGRELADTILSLQPGLKVLFMSGYTGDIVAHRGILDEGLQYLQKPFTPDGPAKKVKEILDAT